MESAVQLLQNSVGVQFQDSRYKFLLQAVGMYHSRACRALCVQCGVSEKSKDTGHLLQEIKLLLEKGTDVNTINFSKHDTRFSVLHIAASLAPEHSQLLEVLLKFHNHVDLDCRSSKTPLLISIANGNHKFFKMLLEKGADPKKTLPGGKTYLHCAVISQSSKHGSCRFVCFEDPWDPVPNAFHSICLARRVGSKQVRHYSRITKQLVDLGVDINAKDCYGNTALHYAATDSRGGKIIIRLIKQGANWMCRDKQSRTPLHCAAMECLFQNVATLVMLGADINCRDLDGCTPLHTLVKSQAMDAYKLLELGSDINMTNNDDLTPLEIAERNAYERRTKEGYIDYGYTTIGQLKRHVIKLLAAGLSVNHKNRAVLTRLRCDDSLSGGIALDLKQYFFHECLNEVVCLKQEKIGESNVTYYDLLTSTRNELVKLAKNEKLGQVLNHKLIVRYPNYIPDLRLRVLHMGQAPRRESLLPASKQAFRTCIVDVPEFEVMLPNHLSDDDLESLVLSHHPQGILPNRTSINVSLPDLNTVLPHVTIKMNLTIRSL